MVDDAIPDKRWIGNVLQITEDDNFAIIQGSPAHSAELRRGQILGVIGVQKGNWLRCTLLSKVNFHYAPGVQMSEAEIEWAKEDMLRPTYSTNLIIGISLNFDRDKFKVIKG